MNQDDPCDDISKLIDKWLKQNEKRNGSGNIIV